MAVESKSVLRGLERKLGEIPGMSALIQEEYSVLVAEERAASQVADLVKQARTGIGLSQAELGKKLGVSQVRVSKLERGDVAFGPSVGLLAKIALACGRALQLSFTTAESAMVSTHTKAAASSRRKAVAKAPRKRRQKAA